MTEATAGDGRRRWPTAAAAAAVGTAGAYAYTVAKFRHTTARPVQHPDPPPPGSPEFTRLIESVTGAAVSEGNRVTVLRNGCRTFPAMLEAIASAREAVDLSSYIYWPGRVTAEFDEALMERAAAGVEVNLLVDGWGSARFDPPAQDRLRRAGVTVAFFRPPRWHTLHKLNNRMHRRLLIVDGRVGFAGGVGIADMWAGDAEDPEHWRETHARVEGPAVRDILGGFLENWAEATQRMLGPAHLPPLEPLPGGARAQVVRSSPTGGSTAAAALFRAAVAGAQKRIWLTTAYFTAGAAFVEALAAAARRGVDVRLLVNGPHVDKEVVRSTGRRTYGPLLAAGARIFEYQPTMLHAKTLVVDDGWANLGSSNFDHRSFMLDDELNLAVHDPAVVDRLADDFLDDLEASEELSLDRWRRRPVAARAREWAGELVRQSF